MPHHAKIVLAGAFPLFWPDGLRGGRPPSEPELRPERAARGGFSSGPESYRSKNSAPRRPERGISSCGVPKASGSSKLISSKLKSSGVRPSSRPADAGCGAGAGGAAGRGASGAAGCGAAAPAPVCVRQLMGFGVREASPGTRGAEGHSIVAAGARPAAGDAERAAGAGGASCSINVLNTAAPILRSFAMRAARASAEGAGGGAAKLFSAARRLASACAEAAELICSMGINAIVGASTLTSPKENEMVE